MDEQAKINKEAVTKFKAMDKILENIDCKVTEVGSCIRQVFNMMKMLETQVGQPVGRPMGYKGGFPRQPQGPEIVMSIQTHLVQMKDDTKEKVATTPEITTELSKLDIPSQDMKVPPRYF
jgi:hypothetical protein